MDKNRIAYIELMGLTLSGHKKPDQGLYWTDLVGWNGVPDLRGTPDLIPGAHGRFKRSVYLRDSRAITLVGHILCDTHRELVAVKDRLESALAEGGGSMIVATGEAGAWERFVEIDTLVIEPDHGRAYTKFTVDMVAPDPRRYGPVIRVGPAGLPVSTGGVRFPQSTPFNFGSVSDAGRLIVHNAGLIPLHPIIEVEGGFSTVSVQDIVGGNRLTLEHPVPVGGSVFLDSRVRRVTADHQEVTRWLTRREWFSVPPGEEREYRLEVTGRQGDPQMWAEYREGAW